MTTAREIMHHGAQCVDARQSLLDAARMMRDQGVGALPICGEDKRLKGMITDRDIVTRCLAEGRDPATMMAKELAGHVHCVRADDDLSDVLKKMENHQIRRIPVIHEEKLVGMISEADLAIAHATAHALTDEQLAMFIDRVYTAR